MATGKQPGASVHNIKQRVIYWTSRPNAARARHSEFQGAGVRLFAGNANKRRRKVPSLTGISLCII